MPTTPKAEKPARILTDAARAMSAEANFSILQEQFEEVQGMLQRTKRAYWELRDAAGIERTISHQDALISAQRMRV